MNVGSLFSGIGGLDHGLARAGFRHVFFCEGGGDPNGTREERQQWATGKWRRRVLAEHWPGVPIYEDVRLVGEPAGGTPVDGSGAPVDVGGWEAGTGLLCGGFPCQDLSVAGQRRGLAGERSGLFHEFARIAESLRPQWLLVENVPGLLSSNGGRDFGIVLGTLADLGYGLAWRIVDSRFFGVPQRRRRVFILGALAIGDPRAAAERAGEVLAVGSRCDRHPPAGVQAGTDVAYALADGTGTRTGSGRDGQDTLIAIQGASQQDQFVYPGGVVTTLAHSSNTHMGHYQPKAVLGSAVRRLTPTECERLQALPDGWTDHGPDSRRYAALGDAVTASVAEWIGRRILDRAS